MPHVMCGIFLWFFGYVTINGQSLPLTRKVAKPEVLTDREIKHVVTDLISPSVSAKASTAPSSEGACEER